MAGGITLLALMTFFLEVQVIVPIHGVVQLVSNGSRSLFLKRNIVWKIFVPFALLAPVGAFFSFHFLKRVDSPDVFLIPLTLIIIYVLFRPKNIPAIELGMTGFAFLGLIAGAFSPLVGATGPLLAPFFFRDDLSKESIIATKALTQTWTHLLKVPVFLGLSFPYHDYITLMIVMAVMATLGTRFGVHLLGRISEKFFRRLYKLALGLAALRLISKIVL